jgi:hypothetical protein
VDALRLVLVYAGSGVAALGLVDHFLVRVGRREGLALLILPLLLTGRAVATGGFYGPLNLSAQSAPLQAGARWAGRPDNAILNDVQSQMVPWKKAVREAARTGHAPLLNRFVLCGDILAAACQPGAFHPATVIGFLLPLPAAWTFGCTWTFFLAGLFGLAYLRDLGVGAAAAFLGASAWSLSFGMTFWIGWPQAAAFAPLPLLLLGLRRIARSQRGGFGAAAAAMALSLLAGHPESTLHAVAAAGIAFLFDLARERAGRRAILRAAAAGIAALCLAAPMLLPFAEALPQTAEFASRRRAAGKLPVDSAGQVLASAAGAVVPRARGPWPREEVPGAPSLPEAGLAYVGGAALALAIVGLASRRREKTALATAGLLAFLAGVGAPGVTQALARLPLFDMALNGRLTMVTAFCLAALAALGLERLAQMAPRRAAAALAAAAAGMFAVDLAARAGGAPGESAGELLLLVLPVLALAGACLLLRERPAALGAAAVALFLVSHVPEIPRLYPTFPARDFYPRVPELSALPRDAEPYRVAGLGYSMVPNQSALWELEDPRGYEAITNARLAETFPLWSVPQPSWFNRIDDPARPFLAFLNTRFLLAGPGAPVPAGGWGELVRGPDCAIFENPAALPRAFAPERVRFSTGGASELSEMAACVDFRKTAWIEDPGSAGQDLPNGRARVSTFEDGPDLVLDLDARSPAWIVVSETFWKGWTARLDGSRRLALHFANHAFLAFEAPVGRHRVELRYAPASFRIGLGLAALAVLAVAAAAVVSRRKP